MDSQHQNMQYISLIPGIVSSSRASQPTPLPPGIGSSLSPMMIPLAPASAVASAPGDPATVVMSSFSNQAPPTIGMIQSMAGPPAGSRTTTVPQVIMPPQSLAPPPHDVITVSTPTPTQPAVFLYKCSTGRSSETGPEVSERSKEKASLDQLQKDYSELNSRKIKDPLSSFLPDIPGEFDSAEPPGTMLLDLVEHKPIGGKEFHPLSGQALLGFRLLPGPLPEQFRLDPPSATQHTKSRKKKKHKHKNIDRTNESSDVYHPQSKPSKPPSDAYSFIKHESHMSSFMVSGSETVLQSGGGGGVVGGATGGGGGMIGGAGGVVGGGGGVTAGQMHQQQVYPSGGVHTMMGGGIPVLGDKKKKKKREKDEKKKKKDKKKRKHHAPPDPTAHPVHQALPHITPPPSSSSSSSTAPPHFPHPHS